MSVSITRPGIPVAPVAIADVVEEYARESGRHGTLIPAPVGIVGTKVASYVWIARFTLRSDDGRLKKFKAGELEQEPTEDVWFVEPNPKAGQRIPGTRRREPPFKALDIRQMGPTGVRAFLDRGNTWSGRGEFQSHPEHLRKVREKNAAHRRRVFEEQRELNRLEARDRRRSRLKIPFLGVSVPWIGKTTQNP